ncbi:MAG: hypothetical protein RIS99_271 [Bacteroidota bacterium]|jgi:uncharacterized protein YfiM (DUF2279 family)
MEAFFCALIFVEMDLILTENRVFAFYRLWFLAGLGSFIGKQHQEINFDRGKKFSFRLLFRLRP